MLDARDALEFARTCTPRGFVYQAAAERAKRRLEMNATGLPYHVEIHFRPKRLPPPSPIFRAWFEMRVESLIARAAGHGCTAGYIYTNWECPPCPIDAQNCFRLREWVLAVLQRLGYRCAYTASTETVKADDLATWFFFDWSAPYSSKWKKKTPPPD